MSRRALPLPHVTVLTLSLAAGACDPVPTFGPPDPPAPGLIVAERKVTTTADGAMAKLVDGDVIVTFPPAALPVGTTVTVRVLTDLHETLDGVEPANVWQWWGRPAAVQIGSEPLPFAGTVAIELHRVTSNFEPAVVKMLFAEADAPTWTRRGPATYSAHDYQAVMTADRAGLWTLIFDAPGGRDAGSD
jgi:hypothetical protein